MSWHEIEHDGVLNNYDEVNIRLFAHSTRPCWLSVDCEGDMTSMHAIVRDTPTLKIVSAFQVTVEWQRHRVEVAVADGESMCGTVFYDGEELEQFEASEPGWILVLPHQAPTMGVFRPVDASPRAFKPLAGTGGEVA